MVVVRDGHLFSYGSSLAFFFFGTIRWIEAVLYLTYCLLVVVVNAIVSSIVLYVKVPKGSACRRIVLFFIHVGIFRSNRCTKFNFESSDNSCSHSITLRDRSM